MQDLTAPLHQQVFPLTLAWHSSWSASQIYQLFLQEEPQWQVLLSSPEMGEEEREGGGGGQEEGGVIKQTILQELGVALPGSCCPSTLVSWLAPSQRDGTASLHPADPQQTSQGETTLTHRYTYNTQIHGGNINIK